MTVAVVELETVAGEEFDLAAANARAAAIERRVFAEVFRPRVRMPLLTWSESRRYLSPEANALAAAAGGPVKYSSSATPYHREVMDALSDPATEIVVCEFPSQDGKTELLNNFLGWRIDLEPGPMLVMEPTGKIAQAWSKDRLAPMLRDTPALRDKVREARARDSDNTILHKKFPGGHLTVVGSNSAADLSARPIRDVLVDEVDRCAKSAGTEGDPIRLAFRRATTFRRGKKFLISSPTIKDDSRIHTEYLLGTQEEMLVPCPHCGEYQFLVWSRKAGDADDEDDRVYGLRWDGDDPETAHYVCEHCGCVIPESEKARMIDRRKWVVHNPSAGPRRRSFRKNSLTSNLVSWRKLVAEWLEIQGKVTELQQFLNTVLCELWDPMNGKEIHLDGLIARQGIGYPKDGSVPAGVLALTASVDTQDDRLEYAVWGWGRGEEAWLIAWELIEGDPIGPAPWKQLDDLRAKKYTKADGTVLAPRVTFIDAGGHRSKQVYAYCRTRQRQNVFAIKGSTMEGAPLLGKATRNNAARAILFPVGSFAGKETLATRLVRFQQPGPGYVHLPEWLDAEQVAQFTRAKLITPVNKGGRKWRKPKREWDEQGRVEQFHLYVYALAALQKLGRRWLKAVGELAQEPAPRPAEDGDDEGEDAPPPADPKPPAPPPTPAVRDQLRPSHGPRRGGGGGWVKRF